jgi:hypothetical protein
MICPECRCQPQPSMQSSLCIRHCCCLYRGKLKWSEAYPHKLVAAWRKLLTNWLAKSLWVLVICNCLTSMLPFMNGWVFPLLSEMWKKLRTQVVLWLAAENFEQMIIYSPTTTIGRWWGSREQSQLVMAIHEGDLIVCEWLLQGYDCTILVMFVLWVGQNWHPIYLQSVIVELFVCNLRDPIHGMEWTIFLFWVLLVYFGGMESKSWSPFEPKVCEIKEPTL